MDGELYQRVKALEQRVEAIEKRLQPAAAECGLKNTDLEGLPRSAAVAGWRDGAAVMSDGYVWVRTPKP